MFPVGTGVAVETVRAMVAMMAGMAGVKAGMMATGVTRGMAGAGPMMAAWPAQRRARWPGVRLPGLRRSKGVPTPSRAVRSAPISGLPHRHARIHAR